MRFAAVKVPKKIPSQPPRTSAAEMIRRIVAGESVASAQPPARQLELPAELDQRVRLVGEW
ncbi:MAG: hypothetical protein V4669_18665 [Pseudomonadota bacterium]